MESVLRPLLIYIVLFLVFRFGGKRALEQSSPFGMVLIFLISASVADAMKAGDRSITNGIIGAMTLLLIHVSFSLLKLHSPKMANIIDDVPTLIVKDGKLLKERMNESRVTEESIITAARKARLTHLNQIKYAILEVDGTIQIIPKPSAE
jgi:uncharacterized membrane protein YcaP (DUF421 family)